MSNNIALAEEAIKNSAPLQDVSQNSLMSFLPFVMIFILFYFMLIRPQMKKQKEHQNLISSVKIGDKIITTSGIIGTIVKIDDKNITLEIAPEVKIKMLRSSIAELINKD